MYDLIEREWEEFVEAMESMQLDPWLDTTNTTWVEQYLAYSWALEMGEYA